MDDALDAQFNKKQDGTVKNVFAKLSPETVKFLARYRAVYPELNNDVVEFFHFRCKKCFELNSIEKVIKDDYPELTFSKLHFSAPKGGSYRTFALIDEVLKAQSNSAEELDKNRDRLFELLATGQFNYSSYEELYEKVELIGISKEGFVSMVNDPKVQVAVKRREIFFEELGVSRTPIFILKGSYALSIDPKADINAMEGSIRRALDKIS